MGVSGQLQAMAALPPLNKSVTFKPEAGSFPQNGLDVLWKTEERLIPAGIRTPAKSLVTFLTTLSRLKSLEMNTSELTSYG